MATQQQAQRAYDNQTDYKTDALIAHGERVGKQMVAIEDDAEALRDILANCDLTWLTEAVVAAVQSPDPNAFWRAVMWGDGLDKLVRERAEHDIAEQDRLAAEAASETRGWAQQAVLS